MGDDEQYFGTREWWSGARTAVVEIFGELDIHAATRTSHRLDELASGERPDLVLDLSGVTFLDCGGLSLLIRARKRIADRGGRLGLVCEGWCVPRLLRLTGLSGAFMVHGDLTSALTAPWDEGVPVCG